jgi:hypothetical protein
MLALKLPLANLLIFLLRLCRSTDWKYAVIRWGYGPQSNQGWG